MNNKEKYDYSKLHLHIEEVTKGKAKGENDIFRKVYKDVILDNNLNNNDVVVYLTMLKISWTIEGQKDKRQNKIEDNFYPISQATIEKFSSINKVNVGKHINKLLSLGHIKRISDDNNNHYRISKHKINNLKEGQFLRLPLNYFDEMKLNRKLYVHTLRAILLSSGNSQVNSSASKIFNRRYYNELKSIHNGRTDIELYESLKDLSVVKTNNKATSSSKDVELKVSLKDRVKEVFEFLNMVCKKYGHDEFKSQDHMKITTTILGMYEVDEVKEVIANRFDHWNGDANMNQHLKPKTLFKPHLFKDYLKDFQDTDKGLELVNYSNLKIKNGEEIDSMNVTQFLDKQDYGLYQFICNNEGIRMGSSRKIVRYGKGIKNLIRVEDSNKKYNGVREHLYYYRDVNDPNSSPSDIKRLENSKDKPSFKDTQIIAEVDNKEVVDTPKETINTNTMNMEYGDEIKMDYANSLQEDIVLLVMRFRLDDDGNKKGEGKEKWFTGLDLKQDFKDDLEVFKETYKFPYKYFHIVE